VKLRKLKHAPQSIWIRLLYDSKSRLALRPKRIYNGFGFIDISVEKEVIQ